MREISITGNLGADAEMLTTKNGQNYVKMRVANHEISDQENETRWFDVYSYTMTPNLMQYMKKGTGVRVIGDYSDSTYTSDKYGVQIGRSIRAMKVEFWNSGKAQANGQQTPPQQSNTTTHDQPQQPAQAPKAPAASQVQAPVQQTEITSESDVDDLPF